MQATFGRFCYALLDRFCSALLFVGLGILIGKYNEDNTSIVVYLFWGVLISFVILLVMDVRRWRREIADSKSNTLSETESQC
jgi:hypothetical protein